MNLEDLAAVMNCSVEELKEQLSKEETITIALKEKSGKKEKEKAFIQEVI